MKLKRILYKSPFISSSRNLAWAADDRLVFASLYSKIDCTVVVGGTTNSSTRISLTVLSSFGFLTATPKMLWFV